MNNWFAGCAIFRARNSTGCLKNARIDRPLPLFHAYNSSFFASERCLLKDVVLTVS